MFRSLSPIGTFLLLSCSSLAPASFSAILPRPVRLPLGRGYGWLSASTHEDLCAPRSDTHGHNHVAIPQFFLRDGPHLAGALLILEFHGNLLAGCGRQKIGQVLPIETDLHGSRRVAG